tara:strand:+ start:216 stop:1376 length:1161 start_codon:yes stop_codon:yes gene_type:complete
MSVDKKIDYVEQDGSLNFIKNSKSVTVPKEFKARKNAPKVKLAYITDAEAKMLKKKKPGTPHKGPKGIPSYDSFGSIEGGRDVGRAGEDVSSAERGDFRGFEGSRNLPPGVQPKPSKEAQALRNQFIVAGGGQRVNPRFFDSRNTISPQELALARASNPRAFDRIRGGGIMGLFTGGGFLGNLIRGIGQRLGFGKRFNQPTYDMSRFSGLPLGGSAAFENLDIRDIYDRRKTDPDALEEDTATGTNYPGANKFKAPRKRITYGDTPVIEDYLTDEMFEEQFGNFNTIKPTNLNDYQGINSLKLKTPKQQAEDDFLKNAMAELSEKQLNYLNSPKGQLDLELLGPRSVFEDRLPLYEDKPFFGSDQEPTTIEEFNEYLRNAGLTQIG